MSAKSPSIKIRSFRISDALLLHEVFYSAVHEIASADYTPEQCRTWAPPIHGEPHQLSWNAKMRLLKPFVAEIDGRIAGYADLQRDGLIDHFFTAGWCPRRGVGTALMNRIHEKAGKRGIAELYSNVSLTARPFFERFGFAVETEQEVEVRGARFHNFRMRKRSAV